MMKRPYLIAIVAPVALALAYWVLENTHAAQGLRQTLVLPAIGGALLLHMIFQVRSDPGIFVQSLDIDAGGSAAMLLRTGVFAAFVLVVCIPWCLWLHTHKRRHLVLALVILITYLLSSFGFMGFIGLAMRGLGK
jgi:hypothetical protein